MAEVFRIFEVAPDAAHAPEAMGTKPKFWYHDPDGVPWLFKEGRQSSGEDWAEKVAAELAGLLGLPRAEYELATWGGVHGTVSRSFLPKEGQFVPGNELLMRLVPGYPPSETSSRRFYRVSEHTIDLVIGVIDARVEESSRLVRLPVGFGVSEDISTALDVFVGYLLFDAWIGNTDRHHANWGWVLTPEGTSVHKGVAVHLAPTFDHASSMGSHELDASRKARLGTKDKGMSVEKYVERARSALYAKEGDRKPLTTLEAAYQAAARDPAAAQVWLDRLARVSGDDIAGILNRVPRERMSEVAMDFAQRTLELNQERLLRRREVLR